MPRRLTADIRLCIAPPKFPFGELRMSTERYRKWRIKGGDKKDVLLVFQAV